MSFGMGRSQTERAPSLYAYTGSGSAGLSRSQSQSGQTPVMRQKLRQHHTEHTEDEEAWQGADANGVSRSASAEFEMDPDGPAGMLLDLHYHCVL